MSLRHLHVKQRLRCLHMHQENKKTLLPLAVLNCGMQALDGKVRALLSTVHGSVARLSSATLNSHMWIVPQPLYNNSERLRPVIIAP